MNKEFFRVEQVMLNPKSRDIGSRHWSDHETLAAAKKEAKRLAASRILKCAEVFHHGYEADET